MAVSLTDVSLDEDLSETFIEVDHFQVRKYHEKAAGDVFLSQKNHTDGRVIATLSDGLGSGIKASVLATLAATMATKFISFNIPIRRAAEIIMNTLPVCSERGISYATFTLVDIETTAVVKIIEYHNPGYVLIRQQTMIEPIKEMTPFKRKNKKTGPKQDSFLFYSKYAARPGDRLVFFSDGVTQSGMGTKERPFGWGVGAQLFILETIKKTPDISARDLARVIVQEAAFNDGGKPQDDISCAVVYFRHPRNMLILTGPPVYPENDREIARLLGAFEGIKVICGGTTANIISRELEKPITMSWTDFDPKVPPMSRIEGADLVTEGIITMGVVSEILSANGEYEPGKKNAATKIVDLLLNSDRITFVVGTKINEAHQDPSMPVELEIRRNVIKKIAALLEERYLKEVRIQYF
ncbi:MAG: serine/threonine-protein phosphatase [Treponema sp.]|jgi:hypothetical protein|nr:serine/threonine-protein phosphatase [Treponema sp.]